MPKGRIGNRSLNTTVLDMYGYGSGAHLVIDDITYNTVKEVDADIKPGSCPKSLNTSSYRQ
jgi:hypothetical protein